MVSLAERLRERIAREGPIPFSEFMRAALYDPAAGYYARGAKIGEGGDFVTSPHVSPAFAATLARLFSLDAERIEGPVDFVEVGAGDGLLLRDFAVALERGDPTLHGRLRLTAIEASADARRSIVERNVSPPPRLLESAAELPADSVTGWIFSNELYDALPTDVVEGSSDGLRELRVSCEGGTFVWSPAPARESLAAALSSSAVELEPGQRGEVCLEAGELHRRLARALARGWLVSFDYGHPARILYHPLARRSGTLAVHRGGRRGGDPLACPGENDLTAHVDWDALIAAGEAEGLHTERLARQGLFLTEAGIFDFVSGEGDKWRVFRIVDPNGMGEEISVLVQSKGVEKATATL